jgi:hypothetical protein
MLVELPANETWQTSAPPSTLLLSTTTHAPTVENAAPAATVSATAPMVLAAPVVVVDGAPVTN